jgi:hypothetical protein
MAVTDDPMTPKEEIKKRLGGVTPPDFEARDDPHGVLAGLPLPVYVTTNYDDFMVQALKAQKNRDVRRDWCRWNDPDEEGLRKPSVLDGIYTPNVANPIVYHLYGCLDELDSLVLTEDDYLDFLVQTSTDTKVIPPRIQQAFVKASLLFLGYRPTDMDFRVLLRSLDSYLSLGKRKHHSVQVIAQGDIISAAQLEQAQEYLARRYGKWEIEMCWVTSRAFVAELRQRWEDFRHGN